MGSRSANPAPVAAKTDEERGMSRIPGNPSNRFWWYLIPGLLVLLWIIIVPAIWNIYLSFTNYRGIRPPRWIGIDNWSRLIRDATFWASFRNSIWMIVAMVVIPILIGLVLASLVPSFCLSRWRRWSWAGYSDPRTAL